MKHENHEHRTSQCCPEHLDQAHKRSQVRESGRSRHHGRGGPWQGGRCKWSLIGKKTDCLRCWLILSLFLLIIGRSWLISIPNNYEYHFRLVNVIFGNLAIWGNVTNHYYWLWLPCFLQNYSKWFKKHTTPISKNSMLGNLEISNIERFGKCGFHVWKCGILKMVDISNFENLHFWKSYVFEYLFC